MFTIAVSEGTKIGDVFRVRGKRGKYRVVSIRWMGYYDALVEKIKR